MGRTLILHGDVLADPAAPHRLRRDCPVALDGSTVLSLGQTPANFLPDQVIDATDCLVLPGLFNAHCHAAMTLVRGWAEDLPFDRWLNERIWVAESALEPEDVFWGTALAACEMIRGGVVAFADHYFWMDQAARVVEQSGLKALLAWCMFGTGTEQEVGGVSTEQVLDFTREWRGAAEGRINTALGPHSPYMCPPELLLRVAREAEAIDVPVHLHLAESEQQVQQSLKRHGRRPVAHLAELGLLDRPGLLAAHCIAVDRSDLELLSGAGAFVAHTPKTYMKLAMGMPPLARLRGAGIPVVLGSDGPASNNDLNLLEGLRLVGLVQKHEHRDPEAAPIAHLLAMATTQGALALGFPTSGRLVPGAAADLQVVSTRGPHWIPRHDLAANLVYAAQPADVRHLFVDGRQLLRDGQVLTLDEERIRAEAESRALRMVSSAGSSQLRRYRG